MQFKTFSKFIITIKKSYMEFIFSCIKIYDATKFRIAIFRIEKYTFKQDLEIKPFKNCLYLAYPAMKPSLVLLNSQKTLENLCFFTVIFTSFIDAILRF